MFCVLNANDCTVPVMSSARHALPRPADDRWSSGHAKVSPVHVERVRGGTLFGRSVYLAALGALAVSLIPDACPQAHRELACMAPSPSTLTTARASLALSLALTLTSLLVESSTWTSWPIPSSVVSTGRRLSCVPGYEFHSSFA